MLFDLLNSILGVLAVGSFFALAFIFPERDGFLTDSSKRIRRVLRYALAAWLIASVGNLLSTLAGLFEQSVVSIIDTNTIRSYVTQISLGRLQLVETVSAFILVFTASRIKKTGGAVWGFLLSLIGVVAPLFQSHTSQAGSHGLAIGSITIHVLAISLWVGAVFSIILMDSESQKIALPRVSMVATWSLIAIVSTGAVSSLLRLGLSDLWLSSYGALILLKVVLLISILLIARRIRAGVEVARAIRIEAGLLLVVLSIGSILSRFTPITDAEFQYDRVRDLVGITMPPVPTLARVIFEYEAEGLILGSLIFVTALYIRGVIALVRRGDKWPVGRTISFAIGISLLDYATSGGIGLYSVFSFQYHMIAHMIISMIAPIALVLGAPITLALRTLPIGRNDEERGIRRWFLSILHSRITSIWTHPIVALAIFDGSLFALYFTPLFGELMGSHFGHLFMNFHFIAAGLLFFYVIIGIDPNPRQIHHLVRIVILLAAMSIHAFFSIALMSSTNLIDGGYFASLERPWSTDLLADQRLGAAIGWAMGEIPIVIALAAAFIQWMRQDRREANRADRNERELDDYNEYLRRLAQGNQGS